MDMEKAFIDDNFFIITSDNYLEFDSRLYGYAIVDDCILMNATENLCSISEHCPGTYVLIIKDEEGLTIRQDYLGQFGLFVYKENNYFALSNSFYLLADYLKDKVKLNFDLDFSLALIRLGFSLSYDNTLIKQIKCLPRTCYVKINTISGKCEILSSILHELYVDIDSREGIDIIDTWAYKWNALYIKLQSDNYNIEFRLSGGFDSRAALATVTASDLNYDKICFFSQKDDLYTHSEDLKIATKICETLGFEINRNVDVPSYAIDPYLALYEVLLAKGGFHKELLNSGSWYESCKYIISGVGGEMVRKYWGMNLEKFIGYHAYEVFNTIDTIGSVKRQLLESYDKFTKSILNTEINVNNLSTEYIFYTNIKNRYHVGRANVELFLLNMIMLAPLTDPILLKLRTQNKDGLNSNILFSLIYQRYLPSVADIPFDNNHTICAEEIETAKNINNKWTRKRFHDFLDFKCCQKQAKRMTPNRYVSNTNYQHLINSLYLDDKCKNNIEKIYGEELYRFGIDYNKINKYHSFAGRAVLLQVSQIYSFCKYSRNRYSFEQLSPDLDNSERPLAYSNTGYTNNILNIIHTARIDIKNYGTLKNKILFSNCEDIFIEEPKWFSNTSGQGYVLQTSRNIKNLVILPKINGKLKLILRIPYLKTSDNKIVELK